MDTGYCLNKLPVDTVDTVVTCGMMVVETLSVLLPNNEQKKKKTHFINNIKIAVGLDSEKRLFSRKDAKRGKITLDAR